MGHLTMQLLGIEFSNIGKVIAVDETTKITAWYIVVDDREEDITGMNWIPITSNIKDFKRIKPTGLQQFKGFSIGDDYSFYDVCYDNLYYFI